MKEQTEILKASYNQECTLINNNSEIYGSCRHKTRFHRFTRNNTGTDESGNRRKSHGSENRTYPERHENNPNTSNLNEPKTTGTYSGLETGTRYSIITEPTNSLSMTQETILNETNYENSANWNSLMATRTNEITITV